jgi:hypothetical protein
MNFSKYTEDVTQCPPHGEESSDPAVTSENFNMN